MAGRNTSTVWDVKAGDVLVLGPSRIQITLLQKSGRLARLRVVAPADLEINKSTEILESSASGSVPSMRNSPRQ
jgi:hypothetical protein